MVLGRWMSDAEFEGLYLAGARLEEIAEANALVTLVDGQPGTGYRPSRSGVLKRAQRMGLQRPRRGPGNGERALAYASHRDMFPWPRILPQHNGQRERRMLQAASKRAQGLPLTARDIGVLDMMEHLMWGRGSPLVIGYHEEIGFHWLTRQKGETGIVRQPDPLKDVSEQLDRKAPPSPKAGRSAPVRHNRRGKAG
jgi:hypothetical protein